MPWWKLGIYGSIAWVLVVAAVAAGLLWYISSHPMGPALDDARQDKAGQVAGMLLGFGLTSLWALLYWRHTKKQGERNGQGRLSRHEERARRSPG
jgi:hypothetical protein